MLESILIWAPQVLQHLDFEALEAKENQRKMLERLDEIVKMVGHATSNLMNKSSVKHAPLCVICPTRSIPISKKRGITSSGWRGKGSRI